MSDSLHSVVPAVNPTKSATGSKRRKKNRTADKSIGLGSNGSIEGVTSGTNKVKRTNTGSKDATLTINVQPSGAKNSFSNPGSATNSARGVKKFDFKPDINTNNNSSNETKDPPLSAASAANLELALDPLFPTELVNLSPLRWLIGIISILIGYIVCDILNGDMLPLPSVYSSNSLLLFGWLFHFMGEFAIIMVIILLFILRIPYARSLLICNFIALALLLLGSLLHSIQFNPHDVFRLIDFNPRIGAIHLNWIMNICYYVYCTILLIQCPPAIANSAHTSNMGDNLTSTAIAHQLITADDKLKHSLLLQIKTLTIKNIQLAAEASQRKIFANILNIEHPEENENNNSNQNNNQSPKHMSDSIDWNSNNSNNIKSPSDQPILSATQRMNHSTTLTQNGTLDEPNILKELQLTTAISAPN